MAQGPDSRDETSSREESGEGGEIGENTEKSGVRSRTELRRVQVRQPRHALEIGQNDRIVASHYYKTDDVWDVLLETYDETERTDTET
ncbi:hypothetical protein [Halorussus pelagicus]|uniref:hypothetical protein n=1 Tax=Halorussus pelagicus TaxID=2505977 RepID=UPI000FFBCA4B|nr:hypothetical protein [Halorussus pelagicus]